MEVSLCMMPQHHPCHHALKDSIDCPHRLYVPRYVHSAHPISIYYFYEPHYEIGGVHTVGQGLYLHAPFVA